MTNRLSVDRLLICYKYLKYFDEIRRKKTKEDKTKNSLALKWVTNGISYSRVMCVTIDPAKHSMPQHDEQQRNQTLRSNDV